MPTLLAILGSRVPLHVFILRLRFREATAAGKKFAVAELSVAGQLEPEQIRYAERARGIIQAKNEDKLAAWSAGES